MKMSGFTLVSAIFIVVILSLVGTYMVSISALTRASSSLNIQGIKAYYAAKSGLEWAKAQVTRGGFNCPAINPTVLSLSQGGFSNFSVIINCRSNTFTEAGISYKIFELSSAGQFNTNNSSDYAARILYATVIQPGI